MSGAVVHASIASLHLFDDPQLSIMPPNHRLAGRDYIEGKDVEGEPFITYTVCRNRTGSLPACSVRQTAIRSGQQSLNFRRPILARAHCRIGFFEVQLTKRASLVRV